MSNNPMTPGMWYALESLEAAPIAIGLRHLAGQKINRESRLNMLVDLGLVEWTQTNDGEQELYSISARGRKALAWYREHSDEI